MLVYQPFSLKIGPGSNTGGLKVSGDFMKTTILSLSVALMLSAISANADEQFKGGYLGGLICRSIARHQGISEYNDTAFCVENGSFYRQIPNKTDGVESVYFSGLVRSEDNHAVTCYLTIDSIGPPKLRRLWSIVAVQFSDLPTLTTLQSTQSGSAQ